MAVNASAGLSRPFGPKIPNVRLTDGNLRPVADQGGVVPPTPSGPPTMGLPFRPLQGAIPSSFFFNQAAQNFNPGSGLPGYQANPFQGLQGRPGAAGGGGAGAAGPVDFSLGTKLMNQNRTAGALQGAATGASIGGVPGAVVGGILGSFNNTGRSVAQNIGADAGFGGSNMDDAWANKDYIRLASNPFGALASAAGIKSNSIVGQLLDPTAALFGSGDTKGTSNYKGYKEGGDYTGRSISDNDFGGILYNGLKEHRRDSALQNLAAAFGTGGDFSKKGDNLAFSQHLDSFVTDFIKQAQTNGVLPTDPKELARLDGSKVFSQVIAPTLDTLIGKDPGTGNRWSEYTGVVPRIFGDLIDKKLATFQG